MLPEIATDKLKDRKRMDGWTEEQTTALEDLQLYKHLLLYKQ